MGHGSLGQERGSRGPGSGAWVPGAWGRSVHAFPQLLPCALRAMTVCLAAPGGRQSGAAHCTPDKTKGLVIGIKGNRQWVPGMVHTLQMRLDSQGEKPGRSLRGSGGEHFLGTIVAMALQPFPVKRGTFPLRLLLLSQ